MPDVLGELNEGNYLSILNNIGDPVFVKDDQSRLVLVNDAFCKVFGHSKAEIIGKTLAQDVSEEEREHFLKIDRQVIADGKESIVEERLTVRGGSSKIISTRKTRFIDERGNVFLIGIIRDITEIKEAEELGRLNELNELLLRAAQLLAQPKKGSREVLRDLTELVSNQFNAVCDVSVLDRPKGIIRPIAVYHKDAEVREIIEGLFSSMEVKQGQGLVGSVIESGEEILIEEVPQGMKDGPAKVNPKIIPVSMIYVPIEGSDGILGSFNLTRLHGAKQFSRNDLVQIRRIGQYISLFVENVLLKEEQQRAVQVRKEAEIKLAEEKHWAEFKLEISSLLADVETDLQEVLQALCQKVTAFFDVVTDFQLINEEADKVELVALFYHNERVRSAIEERLTTREMKIGDGLVGQVVQTGKELFVEELPEKLKEKTRRDGVDPIIVPRSFVYIPLRAHGKILGTIDLTRLSYQQVITPAELIRMRDLADHAARFIDNRLLQQSQQREIERRKRVEHKLARSSKMLARLEADTRQILNTIPVYIARITKDLHYRFLNDAYKQRGVEPRKLEGKHIKELLGSDELEALNGMVERALNGEVVTFEHVVPDSNGKPTHLSVALAPDLAENGEVVGFYSCSTDITSQVIAEKTAQLTKERFESLTLNSGDAFFFHDAEQNILDANQVATDMLGYTREELLGMRAEDIDPRWNEDVYYRYLERLEENAPQTFDTYVVAKNGKRIPVESRFVKRVEDGKMYIQSLLRDRTEKRIQEERLMRSEQNLRLVFDNVQDYIATIDQNAIIESINKTDKDVKKEDVIGASIYGFFNSEETVQMVKKKFSELVRTGDGFEVEDRYVGAQGEQVFSVKYNAIFHEGSFLKAVVILRDITAERTRERSVMDAVLRGQEQERKRLGAELHDGIGQVLSAIALKVSRINDAAALESRKTVASSLTELNDNLQSAIAEVRNISHDLMPDVLEGFGLKEALSQTCGNLQDRSGMLVTFNPVDLNERYDPSIELNLFRITQELLNNAQKHAASKHVFVNLVDHGDVLSLTVEDDGVGFDRSRASDGIGLKNVRSRVNMIRGQFDVESSANSGTLINIEVPKTAK